MLIGVAGAAGALLLGLACSAFFTRLVNRGTQVREQRIAADLRAQLADVTEARLVGALRAEITRYNALQRALRSFAPTPPQPDSPPDSLPHPPANVVLTKVGGPS